MPTTARGIPLLDTSPATALPGYATGYNAISTALNTALDNLKTEIHNDEYVATIAGLPTSGNWAGRRMYVNEDTTTRIWDGSAWHIIGQKTASWVALTPESSYYNVVSNGSWQALSVMKLGRMVYLNGHISTDGSTGNDSTWAYVPSGYRPAVRWQVDARTLAAGSFDFNAYVNVADGALVFRSNISTGVANIIVQAAWPV